MKWDMKRLRSGSLQSGCLSVGSLGPSPPKASRVTAATASGIDTQLRIHYTYSQLLLSTDGSSVCETEAKLTELMSLFPVDVFERQLPPIVLRHQLYSVLSDRTLVDRELVRLSYPNTLCPSNCGIPFAAFSP